MRQLMFFIMALLGVLALYNFVQAPECYSPRVEPYRVEIIMSLAIYIASCMTIGMFKKFEW